VLAKLDKHEDALACYENVVRLDPMHDQAWYAKGRSMGFLGRHGDVIKCCERALEINPHGSPSWILKGLGFCSMDRFHEALSCFQQAEKLGDDSAAGHIRNCRRAHADWYFRLGSRYQHEGNHTEANACYEKGLAMDPSKAVIWVNKGAALLALDRAAEAVTCFDRAIALDPNDPSAWNNKGIALMSSGQREEGAACLLKALKMRKEGQGQ
jgi:superkiller protein 3